ncbi:indolepyruvate oxidoreductase subunit beta family protein [Aminobacter anthyllidis]|uniref:Indolepyruvate oxidoreductase subunit beta family protein n=2 Tax=Aminobacter anthyllidis TaxID=1035067 RepID=A0A9X1D8V3_9HYPH|nr:indolepyruvate oxidoreductase subunit beta family protein [Aminobacter anthyllidis]
MSRPMTQISVDEKPISIAILAMGGQGGGVLADWVVALAEAEGWVAQSTSVPGVAQRTGATIYYVEMLKPKGGQMPVLSLMPTPGDVDVVLAAEFMEAGRSMLRGLVTPDRTTLIASTHRSYAVGEKEVPGDGTGDPLAVVDAFGVAARKTIIFDMQTLAEKNGSVISSAMFGALAGANVLPFTRDAFEAAVRAGGKGVEASLRAFGAAFDRARDGKPDKVARKPEKLLPDAPLSVGHPKLDRLLDRIHSEFPPVLAPMLYAGAKRLVDFQDPRYAEEYLDTASRLLTLDRDAGGEARGFAFSQEIAKYLAVAMAYDDVVRVADLKTRSTRFERVRKEIGATGEQLVYTTEYMHPRAEEVVGTMPALLGQFIENRPALLKLLERLFSKGRRVRTGTVGWFVALYALSSLKPMRRTMLRHKREMAHIKNWLDTATAMLPANYDLAAAVIGSRRLVKGYSDTHSRGQGKFDKVLSAVPLLKGREDGGTWLKRLVQAALQDEAGKSLDGALATVRSFS